MMKLKILTRAGYRGLSWLALNVIMGILHKREGGGDLTMHRRGPEEERTQRQT